MCNLFTRIFSTESEKRKLISLQYNGRIDGGDACDGQVPKWTHSAFQPGLDILIPPTSEQEDGALRVIQRICQCTSLSQAPGVSVPAWLVTGW